MQDKIKGKLVYSNKRDLKTKKNTLLSPTKSALKPLSDSKHSFEIKFLPFYGSVWSWLHPNEFLIDRKEKKRTKFILSKSERIGDFLTQQSSKHFKNYKTLFTKFTKNCFLDKLHVFHQQYFAYSKIHELTRYQPQASQHLHLDLSIVYTFREYRQGMDHYKP
ncbi:hypothetical protein BpHYR1_011060 [Brachionus plicatilis]|uniref:Uncharacterized protein n=1 Tax=Brachionus plicatilis TaxID=10195 RepID=A0A3M7PP40_BRAPC|nr:hypothetical protein BpHYR1_011060 [Brachionus plicatilis]